MSQLRTNAILDASGGTTATVNGIPLRPGVLDPENRIINGAFDFWQRGTSFTTDGYSADRFGQFRNSATVTTSRQAFTLGDTLGNNSPTYFLRQTVSGASGVGNYALVTQSIEGVRSYAGQTITVLGWARRSSGSGNMAIDAEQSFGSGGSPSSRVIAISPTTITLTGSWAPFAAVLTIPSITGKTLGTNGNDYLQIDFWTSAGSNLNASTNSLGLQTIGVDLWGVHIKQGTHTTSAADLYKQPELGPELARCQRYYTIIDHSVSAAIFGVWKATSPFNMQNISYFTQTMRAAPSIANFGSETWYNVSTQAYSNGLITSFVANNSFVQTSMEPSPATSASGYEAIFARFKFSADAEL
jgi:hypothetical protein